jgi:hypothetical protein
MQGQSAKKERGEIAKRKDVFISFSRRVCWTSLAVHRTSESVLSRGAHFPICWGKTAPFNRASRLLWTSFVVPIDREHGDWIELAATAGNEIRKKKDIWKEDLHQNHVDINHHTHKTPKVYVHTWKGVNPTTRHPSHQQFVKTQARQATKTKSKTTRKTNQF